MTARPPPRWPRACSPAPTTAAPRCSGAWSARASTRPRRGRPSPTSRPGAGWTTHASPVTWPSSGSPAATASRRVMADLVARGVDHDAVSDAVAGIGAGQVDAARAAAARLRRGHAAGPPDQAEVRRLRGAAAAGFRQHRHPHRPSRACRRGRPGRGHRGGSRGTSASRSSTWTAAARTDRRRQPWGRTAGQAGAEHGPLVPGDRPQEDEEGETGHQHPHHHEPVEVVE